MTPTQSPLLRKSLTVPSAMVLCVLASAAMAGGDTDGNPQGAGTKLQTSQSTKIAETGKKATAATPERSGQGKTSKTRMGVRIRFDVEPAAVGRRSQVRLTVLRPAQPTADTPLTLALSADKALQLDRALPGSMQQAGASANYLLGVVPQSEGLHYIHVHLRAGDGAESLSIPVQVGASKALSRPIMPKTMPDGQRVISIPAQQ